MASAIDTAVYILEKHGSMATMKLNKLVYLSNCTDEKPLTAVHGVIYPGLFNIHKDRMILSYHELLELCKSHGVFVNELKKSEKIKCNKSLKDYGDKTGAELAEMFVRCETCNFYIQK